MNKKKIFFLGYDQNKTKIIKFLKYKNLSVSVISDDPIYADAMSTALISMDYSDMEAFIEKNNIKVIVLGEKDGKGEVLYISDGI